MMKLEEAQRIAAQKRQTLESLELEEHRLSQPLEGLRKSYGEAGLRYIKHGDNADFEKFEVLKKEIDPLSSRLEKLQTQIKAARADLTRANAQVEKAEKGEQARFADIVHNRVCRIGRIR